MLPNNKVRVDFEKELRTNFTGYNMPLTRWWNIRACNKSHYNAYRNIANYVITRIDPIPSLVIDYGCGTGRLLGNLAIRFGEAKFIGIDGSSAMLKTAKTYLRNEAPNLLNRIKLLKATLPTNYYSRKGKFSYLHVSSYTFKPLPFRPELFSRISNIQRD